MLFKVKRWAVETWHVDLVEHGKCDQCGTPFPCETRKRYAAASVLNERDDRL